LISSPVSETTSDHPPSPTITDLFIGFLGIGLMGFGGVLAMSRRMIVEQRKWLTPAEFTELLGLCQFLPGGNIMNLSVAVGLRFRGWRGAAAALTGLMAMPCIIVVALGMIYGRYQSDPVVSHVFAGLAAAAAGLLVAASLKIALPLRSKPVSALIAVVSFVAIAWFRFPLLPTMLILAPLGMIAAWRFKS
jgi:chromate transporter